MSDQSRLLVIWSSRDREIAERMVFMYTHNSLKFGWWEEVVVLVWGPSAALLAEDSKLQAMSVKMQEDGVKFLACKACSDMYGTSEKLKELGVKVSYMGEPLTEMLKSGWTTLTF